MSQARELKMREYFTDITYHDGSQAPQYGTPQRSTSPIRLTDTYRSNITFQAGPPSARSLSPLPSARADDSFSLGGGRPARNSSFRRCETFDASHDQISMDRLSSSPQRQSVYANQNRALYRQNSESYIINKARNGHSSS